MEVERLQYDIGTDFNEMKAHVIENKAEYKNRSLSGNLVIRGIGEKYLKIENNFYSWNEIEKSLNDYKQGK